MQRAFTVAAALVLFAYGTTFAQSPTTRSTALMGLTNPTIQSTRQWAYQSDHPIDGVNGQPPHPAPGGLTNPMPSVGAVGGGTRRHSTQFGKPDPPARRRPGQHHNMSNDRYGKPDNRHQRWRLAGDDDRHIGDRSVRDVSAGRHLQPIDTDNCAGI